MMSQCEEHRVPVAAFPHMCKSFFFKTKNKCHVLFVSGAEVLAAGR